MMKKFYTIGIILIVALTFLVLSVAGVFAQTPNPKGVHGAILTSGVSDHSFVLSLRQMSNSNSQRRAKFVSSFTVSDSCRIEIVNENTENKLKTPFYSDLDQEAGRSSDNFAQRYIPLAADTPYNFECDAEYIILWVYGDARAVTYSGIIEYHE